MQWPVAAALVAVGVSLSGCGLYVPEVQEWYEPPEQQKFTENRLINHIKCEIHKGLDAALDKYTGPGNRSGYSPAWFKSWIATVSLKLTVEEKGAINPGVSWVRNWTNSTFTLGAGLNGSSDATRIETITFSYQLGGLRKGGRILNECEDQGEARIMGDLKIGQFIDRKIFLTTVPGTVIGPYSAFNYEVSFVVVYGGSVTPTWKLVEVTANPDSPFANVSRSRTHDVTITFAAPSDPAQAEAASLHNASLIGQAVAAALKKSTN